MGFQTSRRIGRPGLRGVANGSHTDPGGQHHQRCFHIPLFQLARQQQWQWRRVRLRRLSQSRLCGDDLAPGFCETPRVLGRLQFPVAPTLCNASSNRRGATSVIFGGNQLWSLYRSGNSARLISDRTRRRISVRGNAGFLSLSPDSSIWRSCSQPSRSDDWISWRRDG